MKRFILLLVLLALLCSTAKTAPVPKAKPLPKILPLVKVQWGNGVFYSQYREDGYCLEIMKQDPRMKFAGPYIHTPVGIVLESESVQEGDPSGLVEWLIVWEEKTALVWKGSVVQNPTEEEKQKGIRSTRYKIPVTLTRIHWEELPSHAKEFFQASRPSR